MEYTKSYIKGHPRNQFTRESFINLNGLWDFRFDDENIGFIKKYYKGFDSDIKINVPYTYQTPKSGINDEKQHNYLWYQKIVKIEQVPHKKYLLHFEGSDYETVLYINGLKVGSHHGAYERFTFDITDYINSGENLIVVNCIDDYSCDRPRGKQRWLDQSYECFYLDTTGIWKTVWLEEVGEYYLKNVKITPQVDDLTCMIEYEMSKIDLSTDIETIITYKDKVVYKNTTSSLNCKFKVVHDLNTSFHHWKCYLWSVDCPNLYDIEFNVYHNGKCIDSVKSYFGMRKIETKGNTIYLNYSPLYLKMVLDQGYFFDGGLTGSDEELENDVKLIKKMGLNGLRKHQKIEAENFLYFADIYGLLVWVECPSGYLFNDNLISNMTNEWIQIVEQNYNHPSIMAYVNFNESWGVTQISNNEREANFVTSLYYITKSLDNTRLVISNDGWEHTKSDLITVHNYAETKEEIVNCFNNIEDCANNLKHLALPPRRLLVDNYIYENQPLILSEFGGISFKRDDKLGWGYGESVLDEEKYLKKLKNQILSLVELQSFSGFCITQLTDVYQEVNGLLDMKRNPKCSIEKLKNIIDLL